MHPVPVRPNRFVLTAAIAAAVLLAACSGDDKPDATGTSIPMTATTASATAVVEASPTPTMTLTGAPTPPLPPTMGPATLVPSTVWLIDVRSGDVTTLYESHDVRAITAYFDDGNAAVLTGTGDEQRESIQFDLAGHEIGRQAQGLWGGCLEVDGGVQVGGRFYAGVSCGPISPHGLRMAYWIESAEVEARPGYVVPGRAQWVIDLQSGQSALLEDGLAICQADSIFWPTWSLSGTYLYFGDCAGDGRTFLSDTATGVTRQIATGLPSFSAEPSWSPVADVLAYPALDGSTVVEDLQSRTEQALTGLRWPVHFDSSGKLLFTAPRRADAVETAIYDVTSGNVLAKLPGDPAVQVPFGNLTLSFVPVVGTGEGFVAALGNAPGCEGTVVYSGSTRVTCAEDAFGPAISPDGTQVVLARRVGASGHVEGPGFGSVSMTIYDVIMVDIATGSERVLARGALGGNPYPTPAVWNEAGTYILVTWPFLYGP